MKKALITGITGQDGSYLAELLLEKDYQVYGMHRRSSTDTYFHRIEQILNHPNFRLICANLLDGYSLSKIIKKIVPDEVYNLAAQSHVGTSFHQPQLTRDINYFGLLRLSKELFEINPKAKLYQASTSELFGEVKETPQTETTSFNPVSPYAKAKLEAHNHIASLRESEFFACAGILFNHESERRGVNFVTRKITRGAAKIKLDLEEKLELGNLYAKRDWGHAKDYVYAMYLMMQQEIPKDYIVGTGQNKTIKEFVEETFNYHKMPIEWEGQGLEEKGYTTIDGTKKVVITINSEFFRPNEVHALLSNSNKAKQELGWEPKIKFNQLVRKMADYDLEDIKRQIK